MAKAISEFTQWEDLMSLWAGWQFSCWRNGFHVWRDVHPLQNVVEGPREIHIHPRKSIRFPQNCKTSVSLTFVPKGKLKGKKIK